ncbi:thiol-disulfide oxidoreductase-associated membrane protein CcdA2 [Streptococcus fryi]
MNVIYMASVFLAGLLSFFSPCILPLLPVYAGILLDGDKKRRFNILGFTLEWYGMIKTMLFLLGLSVVFVILGYGAGFLGHILYTNWFSYVLGSIVIVLGLHQMGIINISSLQFQRGISYQKSDRHELWSSFLLGLAFSLGWSPCVGPILSSVLALAASGGQGAFQGGLLMFVYTLGLAVPFLVLAIASSVVLNHVNKIKPYLSLMKKGGGLLIILMGILLMFGNINSLISLLSHF